MCIRDRRRVVHGEEERRLPTALALEEGHRAVRDQVREIAGAVRLRLPLEEIVLAGGVAMGEVVHPAAHGPEELAVATLERPEVREEAQVPLADERGGIARVAQ